MKLDLFDNTNQNIKAANESSNMHKASSKEAAVRMAEMTAGYSLDINGQGMDNAAYGKEDLKSSKDIMLEASQNDVQLNRNYMAVMSNSLSDEDFAELMKEGGKPSDMPLENVVTNLDKIKVKLAESGTVIKGYNDDLNIKELAAITDDAALTNKIKDVLKDNDLPVTDENIDGIKTAINEVRNIPEISDEMSKYMITNQMEPTVSNLYVAQFSAGNDQGYKSHGYYQDTTSGYYAKKADDINWDQIKDQVTKIIDEAGIEDKEKAIENAKWALEEGIPLTADTLRRMENLNKVDLSKENTDNIKAIINAVSDGHRPEMANLADTDSVTDKVKRLYDSVDEIKDKRIREEIRLAMSVEANIRLARKNMSIDVNDLKKTVEELREAEREYYRPLLMDEKYNKKDKESIDSDDREANLDEKIDLYKSTLNIISSMKALPVDIVSNVAENNEISLEQVYDAGLNLRDSYEKAVKAYEPLMTEVRHDLGDSIKKAFGNVDDILRGMGEEINDDNRKAVRIMGYTSTEITAENLERVREADQALRRVIERMTPNRTLKMIRDNENPLKENIFDLSDKLSEESYEESADKYSDYLARLDRKHDIEANEREAYIGIYRLIRQIEKSDGSLIGDVLRSGDELTLGNILKASRSNRAKGMDISVDNDYGFLTELKERSASILDQIENGFNNDSADSSDNSSRYYKSVFEEIADKVEPENITDSIQNDDIAIKELLKKVREQDEDTDTSYEMEKLREASKVSDSTIELLLAGEDGIAVTIDNILAADALLSHSRNAYKKLMENAEKYPEGSDSESRQAKLSKIMDDVIEKFDNKDAVNDSLNDLAEEARSQLKDTLYKDDSVIDIREKQLVSKQLNIVKQAATREEYQVPVKISDEWTVVNVKIIRGSDTAGKVTINFEDDNFGKVVANFAIDADKVNGYVANTNKNADMTDIKTSFQRSMALENLDISSVQYIQTDNIETVGNGLTQARNHNFMSNRAQRVNSMGTGDSKEAGVAKLYKVAKMFLKAVHTA